MFSPALQHYVQTFCSKMEIPEPHGLTEDESILFRLAYGTLPSADAVSLPPETVLGYVRHALFLRETGSFCDELEEELFLQYVFYPRINSENIEDCRRFFYDRLIPRITGLSDTEAVLEVNRWCAEQVNYQASNDRTESPLTAYYSGIGRCGEESVFTVTALRSVGIPARQIYVPYWAHCDDNHAWVEAFAGGKWHFLGACEPEPVLDLGWFTDAASRAPLACYRRFFDYPSKEAVEECVLRDGCCTLVNVIDRYAPASTLTIRAEHPDGTPVCGARVCLDVVNGAAFRRIAELFSDHNGICSLRLGHVTVHMEVWSGEDFFASELTVSGDQFVTVCPCAWNPEAEPKCFDCIVSPAAPFHRPVLTAEQQKANDAVLLHCSRLRTARISGYYKPEFDNLGQEWQGILHLAAGNAAELFRLWQQASPEERTLFRKMLLSMETKDYRDTPAQLLRNHLRESLKHRNQPHFVEEILCPRIGNEMLECWRKPISDAFPEEQKQSFLRNPDLLMDYIAIHYPDGVPRPYSALSLSPLTTMKLGYSDEQGRHLLFAAVLRTMGLPARLSPTDGHAEYYRDGEYHRAGSGEASTAVLHLLPQPGVRFAYNVSFSVSRLVGQDYQPLKWLDGSMLYALPPGYYRILTSNRLPNGNQKCIIYHAALYEGQTRTIPLRLWEAAPEEMLGNSRLNPFTLLTGQGIPIYSMELFRIPTILLFPDVGKEPTEHILNELFDAAAELRERRNRLQLVFVLPDVGDVEDSTLRRTLSAIPEAIVLFASRRSDSTGLARQLFLEPEVYPLLVLTDGSHRGYYGTCGYRVGTAELVLKLADCMEKS